MNVNVVCEHSSKTLQKIAIRKSPWMQAISVISPGRTVYDSDASYQREYCWSPAQQRALIFSMWKEIPIGSIHVVPSENNPENMFYILDGKQRYLTLKKFFNNEFSIELDIDGKKVSKTWNEINSDAALSEVAGSISQANVQIIFYERMSTKDQINLFKLINMSEGLTHDEHLYCPNFHARNLFQYLWDNGFNKIASHISSKNRKVRDNRRSKGIRLVHNILIAAYGAKIDGTPIDSLSLPEAQKSVEHLHNLCIDLNKKDGEKVTEELLQKMGIDNQFKTFRNYCKAICNVMEHKTSKTKKDFSPAMVLHILVYFIRNRNRFPVSYIEKPGNKELFFKVIDDFVVWMSQDLREFTDNDRRRESNSPKAVKRIQAKMEDLTRIHIPDLKEKNQSIPEWVKIHLKLNSTECKQCHTILTEDNIHLDHWEPKSTSSNSEDAIALCESCNIRLTNNNKEIVANLYEEVSSEIEANNGK